MPFDVEDIEALGNLLGVSPQRFFRRNNASDDDPEDQLRALADAWQRRTRAVKRTA